MVQNVNNYEIKCHSRFSWGYLYTIKGKTRELWSESIEDLKKKVLSKELPWDDEKVPKRKGIPATSWNTYLDDCTTREEVGTWVKSHYKW